MWIRKIVLTVLVLLSFGQIGNRSGFVAAQSLSESKLSDKSDKEAKVDAEPIDLAKYCRFKAEAFDKSKQYPWFAAPRGAQKFAGVPLEISGAIFLWGERNTNNGLVYPEQVKDISVARKFESLYICHGAFFEGPAKLPMCEIVLHYSDGSSASDKLLCGEDSRDWYANRKAPPLGPSGPRSTLAWDGDAKFPDRTQAIRFCLTEMKNPFPKLEVTAIDLVSSKTQTAACIMALTTGKAGLMKRPKDESK